MAIYIYLKKEVYRFIKKKVRNLEFQLVLANGRTIFFLVRTDRTESDRTGRRTAGPRTDNGYSVQTDSDGRLFGPDRSGRTAIRSGPGRTDGKDYGRRSKKRLNSSCFSLLVILHVPGRSQNFFLPLKYRLYLKYADFFSLRSIPGRTKMEKMLTKRLSKLRAIIK